MQSLGVLVLPPVPAAPADLWSRNLSLYEKINIETCWSSRNGTGRAGRWGLNTMSLVTMLSHTSPLFPWDLPTLTTRCRGNAVQQNDLHCFTASLGSLASAAFKPQLPEAHLKPSSICQQNFVSWGNPQLHSSSLPFLSDYFFFFFFFSYGSLGSKLNKSAPLWDSPSLHSLKVRLWPQIVIN